MAGTKQTFWVSDIPAKCQLCPDREITDEFVDGRTKFGPWAIMHPESHKEYGMGLGTGFGQRYQKQPNGRWLKVEG